MALARKFPDLAKIWFMDKDKCNISVKYDVTNKMSQQ